MWRSRSLEEWKTRKNYLIRSLFEDVSISSTIFEGHESASLSFPSNCVYRAESPLPELIIEPEPRKPNLHDDPEELYDALAKEMRRLYRKDFLDIEFSTSSSENSSSEIFNRETIYDNITSDEPDSDEALGENEEKCQIDYDAAEHQIDNDTDSLIQTDRSNSKESSETINIASESLILEVHVHSKKYDIQEKLQSEQQKFTESKEYRLPGGGSLNVSKTTNVIASIKGADDHNEKRSNSESLDVHSQEYEIQENLASEQQGCTESKQYYKLSGGDSPNILKTVNVIESIQYGDDDTEKRSDSESLNANLQEYEIQENRADEQQAFTESKQYRLSEEDSSNESITTNVIESIHCGDDDTEERSDLENLENFTKVTNASNGDSSPNSSHASPELMRQRQPFVSSETPPHPVHIRRDIYQSNSTVGKTIRLSMEVDSKEFSEDVLTSNQEIEITEGSETIFFVTSTPTRKRTSRFSIQRGQKRRLVSYSSSSLFASFANAASQTSFSDCETDWCNFWSNFFVGMPTVYNVCSCNDHVCST